MAGNKEGEKRISAQTIKGVEASFNAFTDTIPTNTENSLIEAPVTANFQAATEKVKSSMESLTETVQSLDVQLNSVAETFVEMDADIAKGIGERLNQSVKPIGKDKMYDKPPMEHSAGNDASSKPSKYDNALPGADTK